MSAYEITEHDHVEVLPPYRGRTFELRRIWADAAREELRAVECRDCRAVTAAADLVRDRSKPGGRGLRCLGCNAARSAAYARTPTGAANQRASARRRIESGRRAEDQRRYAARYAARADGELAADRARLRPDGVKRCRRCSATLPLAEFRENRTRADGLADSCRSCDGTHLYRATASAERRDSWTACVYCHAPAQHGDHVVALSRGGADIEENLAPACADCNLSKGARDLFDWRPDLLAVVADWPVDLRTIT